MQGIVDRILDGKYDYENGSLDFSCAKLELSLCAGEVCEGSFHVYSLGEYYTQGFVSSTDIRMECLTTEFTGNDEEIFYRFHGEHLEEGDVIKGNFCVVSNQGEHNLPFVVMVEHKMPESSVGSVKNLFHFANLAKSSWEEAVSMFYSPEFVKVFEGGDRQYYDCYRGLCVYPDNEQNMEEFLVQINKKQRAQFLVRESEIKKELAAAAYGVLETELNIMRNGWGYTSLQIECEGDFIFTEKEILCDDDFLGNRCILSVFIDTQLCRPGKNFGRVYIYNSHTSITLPVMVKIGEETDAVRDRRKKKQKTVALMECYQKFRMKKISQTAWLKETGEILKSMEAYDDSGMETRLFQAHYLISAERYNEAEWTLNQIRDIMEENADNNYTLYAYYLYLTTLVRCEEDYADQVVGQVERLYGRDRSNWRIAWLLLYLSEEYNKNAVVKWEFLEKQFNRGCNSPVLYIEGMQLLNANPTLLRRLDSYTLQVLYYGARKDCLNAEILEQLLYMTAKNREYNPTLLKILQKNYYKSNDIRVLQEICTLLVRGGRVGRKFFERYEAGVEARLRITNLFEYYMMSVDLQTAKELPKTVLMYFSYQNNLDYERSAFLYWYVVQHKSDMAEIYENYHSKMESFVLEQIQNERINRHLAGIYQDILTPSMINEQTADALSRLLLAHHICVEDLRLKKVIVYQPGNLKENVYSLQDGCAWIPLYGNDSTILFEDAYGNRFIKSVDYTLEKYMLSGKYIRNVASMVKDSTELDIYMNEYEREVEMMSADTQERAFRLSENVLVDERIRRRLYLRIMKSYYDMDNMRALDDCLDNISMDMFTLEERAEVLRYMTLRGRYDEAWRWIIEFGPSFADAKLLMRIVSEKINEAEGVEDKLLAEVALYCFRRGKYDSRIVQYLAEYASCPVKELRDIWNAARSYDLDRYGLSERIILQMLFSGAFVGEKMEIFAYYVSWGADQRIENAFLARCSYEYFVKERLTEELVFTEVRRAYLQGQEIQKVCRLAYLKYYAENLNEITEEIMPVIGDFLQEAFAERIHLNFFLRFAGLNIVREHLFQELLDKTIVEYSANAGAKVTIHYVIMKEDGESSEYLTEPMREVVGGLCFKEFVLFFGESLQYYIMEERDGVEQLTESGNLQKSDIRSNKTEWRYEMVNDILISRTLEDYDTLDGLMDEYYRKEYMNEKLFTLR